MVHRWGSLVDRLFSWNVSVYIRMGWRRGASAATAVVVTSTTTAIVIVPVAVWLVAVYLYRRTGSVPASTASVTYWVWLVTVMRVGEYTGNHRSYLAIFVVHDKHLYHAHSCPARVSLRDRVGILHKCRARPWRFCFQTRTAALALCFLFDLVSDVWQLALYTSAASHLLDKESFVELRR